MMNNAHIPIDPLCNATAEPYLSCQKSQWQCQPYVMGQEEFTSCYVIKVLLLQVIAFNV